jgi:hypothetical protein
VCVLIDGVRAHIPTGCVVGRDRGVCICVLLSRCLMGSHKNIKKAVSCAAAVAAGALVVTPVENKKSRVLRFYVLSRAGEAIKPNVGADTVLSAEREREKESEREFLSLQLH